MNTSRARLRRKLASLEARTGAELPVRVGGRFEPTEAGGAHQAGMIRSRAITLRGGTNVVPEELDNESVADGGENVYPLEVETLLSEHPAVREVAVIGLADPEWGEAAAAVVIWADGGPVSTTELRE